MFSLFSSFLKVRCISVLCSVCFLHSWKFAVYLFYIWINQYITVVCWNVQPLRRFIYIYIYIYSLTGFGTHSSFCLRGGPGIPQQQEEPRPHLCAVQEGGREDWEQPAEGGLEVHQHSLGQESGCQVRTSVSDPHLLLCGSAVGGNPKKISKKIKCILKVWI